MSKNIFDEVKTILENICIDFDEHGYVPTIPSNRDSDLHFYTIYKKEIDQINEALEQAEKQEKLLELYIKIYNGITDYHDYDELSELQKKIEELEND